MNYLTAFALLQLIPGIFALVQEGQTKKMVGMTAVLAMLCAVVLAMVPYVPWVQHMLTPMGVSVTAGAAAFFGLILIATMENKIISTLMAVGGCLAAMNVFHALQ